MVRVRKPQPTLEATFFSTPEQKVMRFLLSEPTSSFTPRVISSKLKGVRGLGGAEGIVRILTDLQQIGLVDFVDNHRAVRLQDDNPTVQVLKSFAAVCDMEGVTALLAPVSKRGVLFGSRASGKAHTDSPYELFVVSEQPEEIKRITASHPLGKMIQLITWTPDRFAEIEQEDPDLFAKLSQGIVIWNSSW